MEKYKIKIQVKGVAASLFLFGSSGRIIDELNWIDNRDFAEKVLDNINFILAKNKILLKKISGFSFSCDSPYYRSEAKLPIGSLASYDSKGKCGFTSWQVGEVTTRTLNFIIGKK